MQDKDISAVKPLDATVKYCGQWYKFGLRGMLFVWNDGDWLNSAVDKQLIEDEIRKEKSVMAKRQKVDRPYTELYPHI